MSGKRILRFRLRTILLLVYVFVLIIPLGSVYFFRLFENELVRQTESELIIHAAYVSAMYKQALLPLIQDGYGVSTVANAKPGDEKYTAISPVIDLQHNTTLPRRPDAVLPGIAADNAALQAGKTISPALAEVILDTLAGIRVTDYRGVVVAGHEDVGLSLAHIEEVQQALQGKYTADLRQRVSEHQPPPMASLSRGSNIRVFVAAPIVHHDRIIGTVLLSRSPRNILKGMYDNQHSLIAAGILVMGITVLSALLTSYAISRPIHALIRQTQRITKGESNIGEIDNPVTHEMALLSHNIAEMADTIAERSDYIRNFAMHISHEFKTPLTAIQGAIELIEEHGNSMPPAQMRKFLSNIMKDSGRLKKLVSRLLELARADVTQPTGEICKLADIAQMLQGYYRDNAVRIAVDNPDDITLSLPEDIAGTVLKNLFENSMQHGASEIILQATSLDGNIQLVIRDNGRGISEANVDKLFTPFFTTKREHGGSGLGLVIIRSLLSAYGADIQCKPQSSGACFEIYWERTDYL